MEILISIALLLVVVALSSVAVIHITRASEQTRCISHLRTIHKGVMNYAADHRGRLPGATTGGQPFRYRAQDDLLEVRSLVNLLVPYLNLTISPDPREWLTAPTFQCPSSRRALISDPHFSQHRTYHQGQLYPRPFGYGNQSAGVTEQAQKLSNFETPSIIITLADRPGVNSGKEAHGIARNVLFLDGHVELIPGDSFQRRTMESLEIIR